MRLEWSGDWPPEALAAVEAGLEGVAFPAWLEVLYLFWYDDGTDAYATVEADEPARQATIHVYPKFLSQTKHMRRRTMAHEAAHIFLARLDEAVENILAAATEKGSPARKLGRATYSTAAESVVEYIGMALLCTS